MKKRIVTLMSLLILCTMSAFAQTVTGTVLDGANNKEPMIGVAVVVKGTNVGVETDINGQFTLPAKKGDVLVFTFIGYKTYESVINDFAPLSVTLSEDTTFLEEVVVVGYGVQKKSDVTGAVASFNKDALEERPAPNLISVLQGSVPGLKVELYGSNAEGSNNSTVIRGSNSINASNSPLIILDGSPYYFSWSELNPDDIESIEVLKDASSAAIYGSRGANGVIIITTKKGNSDKVKINYHGYMTVLDAYSLPEMMDGDTFYYYKNEAVGDFTITERNSFLSKNYTDWVGLALRTGFNHNHTLSISGKTETNNYFVSLNATDNSGIAIGDEFGKYSGRINFEQQIGKWVKFGTTTQINYIDRSGHSVDFQSAYYMNPLAQAYDSQGNLRLQTWEATTDVTNPLCSLNDIDSDLRRSLLTNNYLEVKFPIKGLTYKLNTNLSFDSRSQKTYYGKNTWTGAKNNGLLDIYNSYSSKWLIENILSYTKEFGKHSIFLTAMYSAQHETKETNSMEGTGFGNDVLTYWQPDKATSLTADASEVTENHVSQMFRANYSYDSRYLFTFTIRNDGYSGFGEDRKYGQFPSVALGWNMVKESFIKNTAFADLFNQFKVRLSWGINGNEAIDAYSTLPKLSTRNYLSDNYTPEFGYYPTKLESPLLGWEKTQSVNFGIDYALLKDRITGTLDIYDSRTTDLLLTKTIPSINGASSIWENIGSTHSYGIEFAINSVNISTKDFTWNTNFMIAANRTRLVDVGLYDEAGNPIDDVASGYFIGWPTNCYYDYVFDGIYQIGETDAMTPLNSKPGYVRYKDLNGDGDITPEHDQMVVGSREPKFDASITNTFRYKNVSLSIYATGRYGSITPNYLLNSHTEGYRINLFHRAFWTETYPNNVYPSNTKDASSNPKRVQFYRNADFIKIKDITLSYRLPEKTVKMLNLSKLEVYANVKNLYTFTNWVGLDPEFVGSSGRQRNIPQTRQYTIGLKLSL
ncbi:MAG: TonB-dependent receptor [Bacteroidales bacterium]|nr:TonB-dependent receptor [Bacteroidales bacterium]MDD4670552.1 TonB-dependent receptor [Bacteroidales bacterium]